MGVMKSISLDIEEALVYIDEKIATHSDSYKMFFYSGLRRELGSRIDHICNLYNKEE